MPLKGFLFKFVVICWISELESMGLLSWLHAYRKAQEGDVRLMDGMWHTEGLVEVFHDGSWGTVCDSDWGMEEAEVVCRQLGYRGAISAETGGRFGEGPGKIWLDGLGCKGTESSLSSCASKGWGVTDCSHSEDAGVVCDVGPAFNKSYSLDHSFELSDQLGELFDSGRGCDFNLIFSYSPDEKQEVEALHTKAINTKDSICVHHLILSLFPKFVPISSSYEMVISSNCQPYIRDFTRYLYTRRLTIAAFSMQCLHQLAAEFGAKRLLKETGRLFVPLLPDDTSFRTQVALLGYARRSGDDLLRENVLRYLCWNMEPLVASAQWKSLPEELLKGLLVRTDLVLPDEAWLLAALDAWMLEQGEAVSPEQQAALLGHVRFPMMTPEQLYELPFTSRLYSSNKELFHNGILLGFQFHALNFSILTERFSRQSEQFQPRIYTANPWSFSIDASQMIRGHDSFERSFETPVSIASSLSLRRIPWTVFVSSTYFSSRGGTSVLSVSLRHQGTYKGSFQFSNQLLLSCKGNYVFHVQELKNDQWKRISNIPDVCPVDLTYQFVVRQQYT